MEMIHGVHLERVRPEQVDQVTRVLRETFFAMCFEHGLVHADLHPGNVLVRPAGTVVLVDLGLVKHLDPDAIGKLVDLARCLALGSPQDLVLVVVNLDPHHTHRAWLDLDLNVLGIDADHTFQVHDLLTGARFSWRGPRNFVELVPHEMPGHIFEVRRFARSENQFEYTAGEHWQPLVQLLLDRASRTGEFEPLIAVAHLNEDKLADPGAAFLVWLTVFRREPTRAHLIEQLDRLAGRAGDWNELLTETRSLAEELEPAHPGAAAQLWQMIGTWLRDRLGNRDAAAAPFERAARLNPDATDQAAELLRSDGRWMELIALLLRRAEAEPDAKRRSELYGEVAEIYETKLGQPGEAIAWYERAAAGDPRSSTFLVALHRLYLDSEAWEVLGELLPRLIEVLGPDAPRAVIVDLQVELGTILADHLGRPDDAIESFRDALALDPKHVPALQGLAKVYQDTGQTEALLETSEAEVDASSPAEQARRYADIAAAWHELARLDRAIACWHKLLALEPRNPHAHKGLARALRDDEQWAELANALRAQLKIIDEPFERVALLLELADLLERSLDHVDGAIGAYREVLAVDARNRAATSTQLEPLAQAIAAELPKRLARPSAEALLHLVHRLPEQTDLVRWGNAVDAAAQRAGLLIAGDLAATARMVASGAAVAGGLRPNQRVTELVAYSVSPAYFAVRRHLGLAIE
jgi:tetratricopeptide (TPR) repeat protein